MQPLDAERVKEWRHRRMLSQQEVANRAGTSLFTIQRIERGEGNVRPKTGRGLAAALDVPIEELLPKAPASSQPSFNGLLEEERKWRSQLELLESCVQHKVSRAKYYERELERGRSSDYATARGAENLAILALQEFADFTRWVIDGPVRPLAIALEQVPSPVDPRIAEEFEGKVDVMLGRAKQTTDLLFNHAYHLAETTEQRADFERRRQAKERTAYGKSRIA